MSPIQTNGSEVEFTILTGLESFPYQVEARHLAAALLTLSRKNASAHTGVKIMVEELLLIDDTLTDLVDPP